MSENLEVKDLRSEFTVLLLLKRKSAYFKFFTSSFAGQMCTTYVVEQSTVCQRLRYSERTGRCFVYYLRL